MKKLTSLFSGETILNLLYPRHCAVCRRILESPSALICPKCRTRLAPLKGHRCLKCSKLVPAGEEYCRDCSAVTRYFSEGIGIFHYEGQMKQSILAFKYSGHQEYAKFYARAIAVYGGRRIAAWKPDLLVPVPMYPRKRRIRGYNQAALIARELSELTGIPWDETLVRKTFPTKSQKKLDAVKRRGNLYQALQTTRRADGMRILVIDDVFTTGSTIDAVARRLREAGAEEVFFAVLCIGRQSESGDVSGDSPRGI